MRKNFKEKERLSVTKTFKHKKYKDLECYWKKNLEGKKSIGLVVVGRKREEKEIVISKAIKILNLS